MESWLSARKLPILVWFYFSNRLPGLDGEDEEPRVLAGTRELQGKVLSVLRNSSEPESAVHRQRRNEIAVDINDQATLTARLENKVIGRKLRSSATTAVIVQVVSRSVPVRGESEIIRVFSRPMHVVLSPKPCCLPM